MRQHKVRDADAGADIPKKNSGEITSGNQTQNNILKQQFLKGLLLLLLLLA